MHVVEAQVADGDGIGQSAPHLKSQTLIELDGQVVTCPWHGWQFDVTSGKVVQNPNVGVESYPVEVRGDDVFVDGGTLASYQFAPGHAKVAELADALA